MVAAADKAFLTRLFDEAVSAAMPETVLGAHMPSPPKGRTVVIGAGKGAAQLAAAFDARWDAPLSGVVATRYGYACDAGRIEVIEASHPVPDEAGVAATQRLMQAVEGLGPDDLVVALITGGGSAILAAPPPGFTLAHEQELNEILLASGASITVMNAIRRRFSMVKGGRLAAMAHPAKVISLIVSDIPGDIAADVASGPTAAGTEPAEGVLAHAANHGVVLPDWAQAHMADPSSAPPTGPFTGDEVRVIASARLSLEAAARLAAQEGVPAHILSDALEGESREVGAVLGAMSKEIASRDRPFAKPALILSGGETTVTLRGGGAGGPNGENALAFARTVSGVPGIAALMADTDGIDGIGENAGAFVDSESWTRIRQAGADPQALLNDNAAWAAFGPLGDIFAPGPSGTNVNDFRAILVR
ncbi:MAG: glycerate kinase [Pseudomonadota bacterium]